MSLVSTDPIADMLTRIRNAAAVNKNEVSMPHSKIKQSIADLLVANNFLDKAEVKEVEGFKSLQITINQPFTNARITEITRLSKPGRRMYTSAADMPHVMRGRGIVVVSTSKGIMTGADAKKQGLGGELICKIY
jgi:small subunit ribosomal protein S8